MKLRLRNIIIITGPLSNLQQNVSPEEMYTILASIRMSFQKWDARTRWLKQRSLPVTKFSYETESWIKVVVSSSFFQIRVLSGAINTGFFQRFVIIFVSSLVSSFCRLQSSDWQRIVFFFLSCCCCTALWRYCDNEFPHHHAADNSLVTTWRFDIPVDQSHRIMALVDSSSEVKIIWTVGRLWSWYAKWYVSNFGRKNDQRGRNGPLRRRTRCWCRFASTCGVVHAKPLCWRSCDDSLHAH